jgi:hypothetical protein
MHPIWPTVFWKGRLAWDWLEAGDEGERDIRKIPSLWLAWFGGGIFRVEFRRASQNNEFRFEHGKIEVPVGRPGHCPGGRWTNKEIDWLLGMRETVAEGCVSSVPPA